MLFSSATARERFAEGIKSCAAKAFSINLQEVLYLSPQGMSSRMPIRLLYSSKLRSVSLHSFSKEVKFSFSFVFSSASSVRACSSNCWRSFFAFSKKRLDSSIFLWWRSIFVSMLSIRSSELLIWFCTKGASIISSGIEANLSSVSFRSAFNFFSFFSYPSQSASFCSIKVSTSSCWLAMASSSASRLKVSNFLR